MDSTYSSPRSLCALFVGVIVLHGLVLFFQTFSQDMAYSLSQTTSGMRVYFEQAQQRVFTPAPVPKPVVKKSISQMAAPQQVSTPELTSSSSPQALSTQDIKLVYLGELRQLIESKKVYPQQAKRLGQTGTVEVTFTLSADGHILNAHVTQSSPYERLNQAALATINEVRHFRPIPPEIGEDSMTVKIPMRYSLYQ